MCTLARRGTPWSEIVGELRGEGDSRFAVFSSAPDAVAAALAIQRAFAAEPWPTPRPISVRIGVHAGEAELRDGDYYGSAVNRCARIRGIGHGGQVLLSAAVVALVAGGLPTGASLTDLGELRLKDLTQPERVAQLTAPDLPSQFPPLASLGARPHNLPVQPTALLGREQAVAEVLALFGSGTRLVTLTGPDGTGKTRLSMQVAAEMVDQLADGAWLVELAPIADPALVPSTIAQALGVREFGGRPALDVVRASAVRSGFVVTEQNAPAIAEVCALDPTDPDVLSDEEAGIEREQALIDQAEAAARNVLGDDAFEAARAEGAALPLDEAVDIAVAALAQATDQV